MKFKKRDFTLVELIATKAIVSLVSIAGLAFISNIIKNTEEESTELTEANVLSTTRIYVKEHNEKIAWHQYNTEDKKNLKYTCVPTNELINKGLIKNDIKNKDFITDYIIVNKEENNMIISEELDKNNLCSQKNYVENQLISIVIQ